MITLGHSEIMKKNISININNIIFQIEEDGYYRLKKYMDSIQEYFSTFENSTEITADIESRIAEISLSKLKESKPVITNKDVENLVSIMSIDFLNDLNLLAEVVKREYLKEIWKNSSQTEKIKFEMSGLMVDLKGKISHFGKDSITKGITKITGLIKIIFHVIFLCPLSLILIEN